MNRKWPYRWFGFWKEQGQGCENCPSIDDFRTIADVQLDAEERKRIGEYLSNGAVVVSTSRRSFPCLISGEVFTGAISVRTDGVWIWRDDLVHYFTAHDISLPEEFLRHIRANAYRVPSLDSIDRSQLQFPR